MTDFNALYRKYATDVFRFALYLSGSRADADITSETFVRVWTSLVPVEPTTVKSYLFTIARNLFLQELRKRRPQTELDERLLDPRAGPQAQAEQKAELHAVLAGLQRLPETDRAALLMRALEDLPYEEIARGLRISLASVKVKIHRAG